MILKEEFSNFAMKIKHAFSNNRELESEKMDFNIKAIVLEKEKDERKLERRESVDRQRLDWFIVLDAEFVKEKYESRLGNLKFQIPYEIESQIEKDLKRSLSGPESRKSERFIARLRYILQGYCKINPSLGYCQGMNTIAAGILLAVKNEEVLFDSMQEKERATFDLDTAFWTFTSIIERNKGYYVQNMCALNVDQLVLKDLMVRWVPNVLAHLIRNDVDVNIMTSSWFICLFAESPLPIEHAWKLWDLVFKCGYVTIFEACIAIFQISAEKILKLHTQEEILIFFLQKLQKEINTSQIPKRVLDLHEQHGKYLTEQIKHLREFHKMEVINQHLDGIGYIRNYISRMASQLKTTIERMLVLWRTFHEPSPWKILESGVIEDFDSFRKSFSKYCWGESEIAKWRSASAVVCIFERLFVLFTADNQGQLSFVNFAKEALKFDQADWTPRVLVAFRFFDIDGDMKISRNEFIEVSQSFLMLYTGDAVPNHAREFQDILCLFGFDDEKVEHISHEDFLQKVLSFAPVKQFFRLDDSNLINRMQKKSKVFFRSLST
jgi:hypothetical protein